MKLKFKSLLLIGFVFFSAHSYSLNSEEEIFVKGCTSLVKIYDNRTEKSFLADKMASNADSFGAGYCKGVLETLGRRSGCSSYNWYELASFISAQEPFMDRYSNSRKLFSAACGS
ncbi:MAG: hypothetical protein ACI978_002598 [Oleispira sp.]|jgi:hypothetical protein